MNEIYKLEKFVLASKLDIKRTLFDPFDGQSIWLS